MTNHSKRQEILEAAARLFRDYGYPATSMRQLAKAVNLKASSLYNHIGSKEEILKTICFQNASRFEEGMKLITADDSLNIAAKVQALIRLHIQVATEDFSSVTAFNNEWRHLSDPHYSEFLEMRRAYEDSFRRLLQKGMEENVFKLKNPTVVLYTLLSSFRWLYDWYKPERAIQAEQIEEEMIDTIMNGLFERS